MSYVRSLHPAASTRCKVSCLMQQAAVLSAASSRSSLWTRCRGTRQSRCPSFEAYKRHTFRYPACGFPLQILSVDQNAVSFLGAGGHAAPQITMTPKVSSNSVTNFKAFTVGDVTKVTGVDTQMQVSHSSITLAAMSAAVQMVTQGTVRTSRLAHSSNTTHTIEWVARQAGWANFCLLISCQQ